MSIRKHPTKDGWWYINISQGRGKKQLYFPYQGTEADALVAERTITAQIKGIRVSAYPTITEALPDYLTYYKTVATEAIVTDMMSVMRRCLLPVFGKFAPHQIVPMTVYQYTAQRIETVSHRTVEKELNYLSAMCRWLHNNGMAEKMPHIPKPPKVKTQPKKIQTPLGMNEFDRLLNQVPRDKKVLLLLMADAGLRMSEALNLKTADIDLENSRIRVSGKGGKVVLYPILTRRLLSALSESTGEYVAINPKTGEPYGSLKTMLASAASRAGINKRVTHHTLRHTFSTLLMESGISTEVRRLLMRHSSLSATEHYTHISPGFLALQGSAFSDKIDGCKSVT